MKVLVMYVNKFSYRPAEKNLEGADDCLEGKSFENSHPGLYPG
jgi:hypothetical protein